MSEAVRNFSKQRGLYFALCKEAGFTDGDYRRDMNESVTGKRSTTDFQWRDWKKAIEHLNLLLGGKRRGGGAANPAARPAPKIKNTTTHTTDTDQKLPDNVYKFPSQKRAPSACHPEPACPEQSRRVEGPMVKPEQLHVIDCLYTFLGFSVNATRAFNKRIIKKPWPQTPADGQKILYALFAQAAPAMIKKLSDPRFQFSMTEWELGFMYHNEQSALKELQRFTNAKNRRGQRTMPRFSLTKYFEILNKCNG